MINQIELIINQIVGSTWITKILMSILVIATAVVIYKLSVFVILKIVRKLVERKDPEVRGNYLKTGIFRRASLLIPLSFLTVLMTIWDGYSQIVYNIFYIAALFIAVLVIDAILNAIELVNRSKFQGHPNFSFRIFSQIAKIFLFIVFAIISLSLLFGMSPYKFITGFSAMTAVVLLIFRDTILSIVSSMEISSYDLVRIGDWIEMPSMDTNGEIIEINLHQIKVQNWDKTVTTIPTLKLTEHSFKNWRHMKDSGSRRIKRSINIDLNTIKICSPEMIESFRNINILRDYITKKENEILEYNRQQTNSNLKKRTNYRGLTNIGVFRTYIEQYLKNHKDVNQDMTFLVRQLQPNDKGLPLEIYAFINETNLSEFERIQSDIFDFLIAILPEFELKLFQLPSGRDFKRKFRPEY
jgi:miniconductance mechanosensitive channel